MKRLMCVCILFAVLVCPFALSNMYVMAASTGELLTNPGFEDGDTDWIVYGDKELVGEVNQDIKHTGSNALLITNRTKTWSSYTQRIEDILTVNGQGEYTYSAWVRAADGEVSGPCMVLITIKSDSGQKWFVGQSIQLTQQWQKIEAVNKTISWEGDITEADIYIQTGTDTYTPDVYVDDFSLIKESAVNGQPVATPVPTPSIIKGDADKRGEKATIGAIRWDAWDGLARKGDGTSIVEQVEKTLSPAKYHFRVPFFGEITSEGKVQFDTYTQEICDEELLYAADAGIDYFAYMWYPDGSGMEYAREFHATSQYKEKVKMCSIFDGNAIGKKQVRTQVLQLLKSEIWQTVQGDRPLMYYFGTDGVAEDVAYYRNACSELGIAAPYVIIVSDPNSNINSYFADGISNYGFPQSQKGEITYKNYTDSAIRYWNRGKINGCQVIPIVSLGRNLLPRYDNPVSWTVTPGDEWVQYATPAELATHLQSALTWNDENTKYTLPNSILMYAWNEYDEGGWLSPTIAVDAQGNPKYNADGTYQIDRSRLDAIKEVIKNYKSSDQSRTTPIITATNGTNATYTVAPTVTAGTGDGGNGTLWLIIGAAAVVSVALGGYFIMRSKSAKHRGEGGEQHE